jgi:hypothetical protein
MAYSNLAAQSLTTSTTTTLPYPTFSETSALYSLRDELASRATEKDIEAHRGITSDGGCTPITEEEAKNCPKDWVRTREQAKYHYADAMIAARNL